MTSHWTNSEKTVARLAFESALALETGALLATLKRKAAQATDPEDIWALHDFLTARRREMDDKYDFRYSQLVFVFARLLREGWLQEEALRGLGQEKLQAIRLLARG